MNQSNGYIESVRGENKVNRGLIKSVAAYITGIFDVLGLIAKPEEIGFPSSSGQGANVSRHPRTIFPEQVDQNVHLYRPRRSPCPS